MSKPTICLVEDDDIMGESLFDRFVLEGYNVKWHLSATAAIETYEQNNYALILTDINMPDMNGDELFYELLARYQYIPPVIFITGYGSVDKAVGLLKLGASDYITKPFDLDSLVAKVQALAPRDAANVAPPTEFPLLGVSTAMRRIEALLPKLAASNTNILVTGESGVGKEMVARRIHELNDTENNQPFVAVNCGALSESLLESELFGHEKGAFTGANRLKRGVFEQADGGTLLLDEIGEMPLNMQVNLLRVIQEQAVTRVGGEKSIPINVRIICATNRDLVDMVARQAFREDLYYRINVIHLHVPPLRDRREDIPWFARLFLEQFQTQNKDAPESIEHSAEYALINHPWPGNLRELKHAIERACVLSDQANLTAETLLSDPTTANDFNIDSGQKADENLHKFIRSCERDFIVRILELHAWHVAETADALGISRKNLWEKMKKLEIQDPAKEG